MNIEEIQEEVIQEFSIFDSWMDKYEYLIDLGKHLPLIDNTLKTEDYLIKGCQSKVWLNAEKKGENIIFTADSDAVITKGIIALLIRVLSDQPATAITNANLYFIDKIGLKDHLSPTRSNGLLSMIKQMKLFSIALSNPSL